MRTTPAMRAVAVVAVCVALIVLSAGEPRRGLWYGMQVTTFESWSANGDQRAAADIAELEREASHPGLVPSYVPFGYRLRVVGLARGTRGSGTLTFFFIGPGWVQVIFVQSKERDLEARATDAAVVELQGTSGRLWARTRPGGRDVVLTWLMCGLELRLYAAVDDETRERVNALALTGRVEPVVGEEALGAMLVRVARSVPAFCE